MRAKPFARRLILPLFLGFAVAFTYVTTLEPALERRQDPAKGVSAVAMAYRLADLMVEDLDPEHSAAQHEDQLNSWLNTNGKTFEAWSASAADDQLTLLFSPREWEGFTCKFQVLTTKESVTIALPHCTVQQVQETDAVSSEGSDLQQPVWVRKFDDEVATMLLRMRVREVLSNVEGELNASTYLVAAGREANLANLFSEVTVRDTAADRIKLAVQSVGGRSCNVQVGVADSDSSKYRVIDVKCDAPNRGLTETEPS